MSVAVVPAVPVRGRLMARQRRIGLLLALPAFVPALVVVGVVVWVARRDRREDDEQNQAEDESP